MNDHLPSSADKRSSATVLTDHFDRALLYATHVHGGQARKGTSIPYIAHLLAVASTVLEYGGSEDITIAALLHDAVEDQGGAGDVSGSELGLHQPGRVRLRQHALRNDVRAASRACHLRRRTWAQAGATVESAARPAGGVGRRYSLDVAAGVKPIAHRRDRRRLWAAVGCHCGAGFRVRP